MKRVLITRAEQQASLLVERVREAGFEAVLIPTIETVEPVSFTDLDVALGGLADFDWVVFTSANAVEAFVRRVEVFESRSPVGMTTKKATTTADANPYGMTKKTAYAEARAWLAPSSVKIAAIGPATAAAVEEFLGRAADVVPVKAVAEALAEALTPYAKKADGRATRFLLPRAETARDHLPDVLRAAGAEVTIAAVYRTVMPEGAAARMRALFAEGAQWPDAILFTSSSTVHNLFHMLESEGIELPEAIKRVSIGPITSQTLREQGFPPHVEAREAGISSLVEAVSTVV